MTDTQTSARERKGKDAIRHEEDSAPDDSFLLSSNREIIADVRNEKDELIARVSASLMRELQFPLKKPPLSQQAKEETQNSIRIAVLVNIISTVDSEFVLKLALYVRHDLNIRRTAALLVALCAFEPNCQPFLTSYMKRIICLPSDWLSIASIAMQKPHLCLSSSYIMGEGTNTPPSEEKEIKGLPNALRHALVATFTMFDDFALAKYNNERSVKRKRAKKRKALTETAGSSGSSQDHPSTLTFKDLIRRLHISRPAYTVCCLLGKRYPSTEAAFRQRGLDEVGTRAFDPTQCGKRMKLPVPETWETQLSAHGNHGYVWDSLVERKKLPFMAALRNLRNMVLHNCSEKTHATIMSRLTSEEEVIKSRQFPHRFLTAFEVIQFNPKKAIGRLYTPPPPNKKRKTCKDEPPTLESVKLLQKQYKAALNQAAEISARVNIAPIRGTSLIILDASYDTMYLSDFGPPDIDKAALLAVSFKLACEHCELLVLCGDEYRVMGWEFRDEGGILENSERVGYICRDLMYSEKEPCHGRYPTFSDWINPSTKIKFPYTYLDNLIKRRVNLQALVVMGGKHSCYTGQNKAPSLGDLPDYLERIRWTCNEDLLYVGISTSFDVDLSTQLRFNHKNDVLLTGFSDSVLRVVAERVSIGPRKYIERADEVYDVNRVTIRPNQAFKKELQVLQQVFKLERERRRHSYVPALETTLDESPAKGLNPRVTESTENVSPTARVPVAAAAAASIASKKRNVLLSPEPLFLSIYRNFRFFISSTFLDMDNERNALVLDVFPRLRHWAAEAGLRVNILEVDLRWGITEDATSSNLSSSVCLNEVSRCAPFFLGVLGSRYGHCPSTFYHRVDEDVDPADFAWLQGFPAPHSNTERMSVTEMEMRHAIFTAMRRTGERTPLTTAFFIRDQATLMGSLPIGREREIYAPDTPTTMQSIAKLTAYLKTQGAPIIPYTATHKSVVHNPFSTFSMTNAMAGPSSLFTSNFTSTTTTTTVTGCVPLDMSDFSRKAFIALKSIIQHHLGLPMKEGDVNAVGVVQDTSKHDPRDNNEMSVNLTLYKAEHMDQLNFSSTLLKTFVPPMGFVEKLFLFVLSGRDPTISVTTTEAEGGTIMASTTSPDLASGLTTTYMMDSDWNVLLLQGAEGNGASSVSAALASHVAEMGDPNVMVVYFSCQASDGSPRRLAYYIAFSLVYRLGLQEDFCVRESDHITMLLQLLPRIYTAAKKKKNICIILDGMDKSPYAADILRNLGWLVCPGTGPEIRFLVTTIFGSPFMTALKSRLPQARSITLPQLSFSEQAELVRRHLASHGKRLQESFRVNELRLLLQKTDANQASYLVYAITYLRLFSTFDTLRNDIVQLPSTLSQLHLKMYKKLEECFGYETCRTVLIALYLSHEMGGIREFNLYRLVSNVASASCLVVLLKGTCLRLVGRRLRVSSASFEASIVARYLPRSSDVVDACAKFLAAELYFRPVAMDVERSDVRESIRRAVESIQRGRGDTCVFHPQHYSAGQLLALLHLAVRAKEYDAFSVLASYLPLLENLIVNATYLQRFLNILSQTVMLNVQLSRKLGPIVNFLQQEYSILEYRPTLLRQCVRNRMHLKNIFHGILLPAEMREACDCKNNTWINWLNGGQKGEEGRTIIFPSTEPLQCLALSDDGHYIAGGGNDLMVRVIPQGTFDQIAVSLKHNAPVTAIAFLPDRSHILVTGCSSGILCVWSLEDSRLLQQSSPSHRRCISSIACHPTESIVVTGSYDTTCALWHVVSSVAEATVRSSLEANEVLKHHNAPVSCMAYHSSGEILATGSWEGRTYFINTRRPREHTEKGCTVDPSKGNAESSKLPYEYHMVKTGSPIRALAFMPSMVVTCAIALYGGDICLYDYASAGCSARLKLHAGIPITCVAFSPDAALMASANEHGGVRITYAGVAGTTMTTLNGHCRAVMNVAFHPKKSNTLFTSSLEQNLKEWSLAKTDSTDAALLRGKHAMTVTACAAASDGSFFVTAGVDGVALVFRAHENIGGTVYDYAGSKEKFFTPCFSLSHEQNRVSCICIGMQNQRIICGTAVGEVFVWAATPGLDCREGLLLQRICVAHESVYPVVFVGCVVEQSGDECKQQRKHTQQNDTKDRDKTAEYAYNVHQPLRARAMALTTNGMMAAWEMFEDDTRMTCTSESQFPPKKMDRKLLSPYSLQQVGVVVKEREEKTEEVHVYVCEEKSAKDGDEQQGALLAEEDTDSYSSYTDYERWSCYSTTTEENGGDAKELEESEEVSRAFASAENTNKNKDEVKDDKGDAVEEKRRAAQRGTLKWMGPFHCVRLGKEGNPSGVGTSTSMSDTPMSVLVRHVEKIVGAVPLRWCEREAHGEEKETETEEAHQKECKAELGDSNNDNNDNDNNNSNNNENNNTNDAVTTPDTAKSREVVISGRDASCENRDMRLLVGSYIVVGRQRCHLAVASLQAMIALPIQSVEAEESNGYMLENGDEFLCVSNCIRVQEACAGINGNNSALLLSSSLSLSSCLFSAFFALGTSSGMVLLLEIVYETDPAPTAETEAEVISFGDNDHNDNNDGVVRLLLQHQRCVRLIIRHSAEIVGRHGMRVPVESIALTAEASQTPETSEDTTGLGVWRDIFTPLHLTVGCRDGSTRLFTVFPFRELEYPLGNEEGVIPGREGQVKQEDENSDDDEECVNQAEKEAKCAFIKGKWHERGIFFGSSRITAVTVLQMPYKMVTRQSPTDMRVPLTNTTITTDVKANTNVSLGDWLAASWSMQSIIHIAGDWLGNVYQLRLEHDDDDDDGNRCEKSNVMEPDTFPHLSGGSNIPCWSSIMRGEEYVPNNKSIPEDQSSFFGQRRETGVSLPRSSVLTAGRRESRWRNEERSIAALFAPSAHRESWPEASAVDLPVPVPAQQRPSVSAAATTTLGVPAYEMILQSVPPELEGEKRQEWIRERRRLLAEALQAQRNAVKAREVLAQYSKEVLLSLGVKLD